MKLSILIFPLSFKKYLMSNLIFFFLNWCYLWALDETKSYVSLILDDWLTLMTSINDQAQKKS